MPLIVEPIAGVKSVALCWLVAGGSSRDPADKQGLSSMWSELLLRGAGARSARELANALDAVGASHSINTGVFHLAIAATTTGERLADLLPILTDMVLTPRFEEDAIEPTRELSLMEIEALKDDPHGRVMLLLRENHAPPPINRSGLGTPMGLRSITRTDIVEQWSAIAKPRGSILAIAGAVDPDAVHDQLERLLESWEGETTPVSWDAPTTRGLHCVTEETNQVHIALAHDAPPERDAVSALERIVAAVLSGGMAGRLFTEVRERRSLCYSVNASYSASRDFGRVVAYVGSTPDKAQEALDTLAGELQRINGSTNTGGGATQEEFDRAVVGLRSRVVMSGESTAARAAALASDMYRLGRPRTLDEILEPIKRATLDDVNRYLESRTLGDMTIATIGPAALAAPAATASTR